MHSCKVVSQCPLLYVRLPFAVARCRARQLGITRVASTRQQLSSTHGRRGYFELINRDPRKSFGDRSAHPERFIFALCCSVSCLSKFNWRCLRSTIRCIGRIFQKTVLAFAPSTLAGCDNFPQRIRLSQLSSHKIPDKTLSSRKRTDGFLFSKSLTSIISRHFSSPLNYSARQCC